MNGAQAPMSRVETDTYINDRYAAIEDRLSVGCIMGLMSSCMMFYCCYGAEAGIWCLQVVRKRLNRPLTFAEKVRKHCTSSLSTHLAHECKENELGTWS